MVPAFKSLVKVLKLEQEQNYRNRAVSGGLDKLLNRWLHDARRQATQPDEAARVEALAELLAEYPGLETREARMQAVQTMLDIVYGRIAVPSRPQTTGEEAQAGPPWIEEPEEAISQAPSLPGAGLPARLGEGERGVRTERPPTPRAPRPPSRPEPALGLNAPVTTLQGVGPKQAERLARLGVHTIGDLVYLFPRRYDDYSRLKPINRLEYGEEVTIIGTIWETHVRQTRGGAPIVQSIIGDGSGTIQATWFNQPYLAEQLRAGRQIVLSGKVDEYLGRLVLSSPEWEPLEAEQLHTARIVPVYPLVQGLHAHWMRRLLKHTIDYWARRVPDPLPPEMRQRLGLMDIGTALTQMHFPDTWEHLEQARRRLAFDELLLLQLGIQRQGREWRAEPGLVLRVDAAWLESLLARLPFRLTAAQERALGDIRADLASGRPMNRLLQGDVGSGKTVIAAIACAIANANGAQAALMAPTEILAEQHYRTLVRLLGSDVALLTGSTPEARRAEILRGLAEGSVLLVVGTHALIQPGVMFARLGLAVIDEQHRFGVAQRAALRQKGYNPHVLVMTATPIPRTLALTMFGDLDLSIIDEMPPGRPEIKTRVISPGERQRAYNFVRRQIEQGRQAFIICPLVEDSEKIEAAAAIQEYERLQKEVFPQFRLGLLHGRMKGPEKEAVMVAFHRGELDILVSTPVVEVGIDVPNATVMLIEGANRFGLAQLHQFRGRVGRGEHPSYCLLISDEASLNGDQRLQVIESTQDGFLLAEKDLEMRGPGEFLGTRQSGLPEMRLARLSDLALIELARREAQALLQTDPTLERPEHALLAQRLAAFWNTQGDMS